MNNEKEFNSTGPIIVKLINTIGKAGKNEVYNIDIDNINYNELPLIFENIEYIGDNEDISEEEHSLIRCLTSNSVNNDSISLVIIYRNKLDDEYHY